MKLGPMEMATPSAGEEDLEKPPPSRGEESFPQTLQVKYDFKIISKHAK